MTAKKVFFGLVLAVLISLNTATTTNAASLQLDTTQQVQQVQLSHWHQFVRGFNKHVLGRKKEKHHYAPPPPPPRHRMPPPPPPRPRGHHTPPPPHHHH